MEKHFCHHKALGRSQGQAGKDGRVGDPGRSALPCGAWGAAPPGLPVGFLTVRRERGSGTVSWEGVAQAPSSLQVLALTHPHN